MTQNLKRFQKERKKINQKRVKDSSSRFTDEEMSAINFSSIHSDQENFTILLINRVTIYRDMYTQIFDCLWGLFSLSLSPSSSSKANKP